VVNKFLGLLALIGTGLALFFRGNAYKAKSKATKQRLDISNAANDRHRRTDKSREKIKKKHRQEQQDEESSLKNGSRDHLDRGW